MDNRPSQFLLSYCGKEYYIKFLYCIKARTPNERKIKGGGGIYGYAWASRARKSTDFHRFRCISLDYCGKYVEITRHTLFLYVYVTISRIFQEIPGKSLTIYIKSIYNEMCKRRVARVLHIFCCAGMHSAHYSRYRQGNCHRAVELCGKAGKEINRIIKDGGGAKQYPFKTCLEASRKVCIDDTDKHLKVADKPSHKGIIKIQRIYWQSELPHVLMPLWRRKYPCQSMFQ